MWVNFWKEGFAPWIKVFPFRPYFCRLSHQEKQTGAQKCCFSYKQQKNIKVHPLTLTLKASNKNCSRQHFNFSLLSLEENKAWFFHVNPLPSRGFTWNIKSYFLYKITKKYLWMLSAAVVIRALGLNMSSNNSWRIPTSSRFFFSARASDLSFRMASAPSCASICLNLSRLSAGPSPNKPVKMYCELIAYLFCA